MSSFQNPYDNSHLEAPPTHARTLPLLDKPWRLNASNDHAAIGRPDTFQFTSGCRTSSIYDMCTLPAPPQVAMASGQYRVSGQ
jgi:hypothetical protein